MIRFRSAKTSKRTFLRFFGAGLSSAFLPTRFVWAKTYLSVEQAQSILLPEKNLIPETVMLEKAQMKQIAKASKTRVRSNTLKLWRSPANDWFIVDQIIGKHENIDMAFALDSEGAVLGLEVLTYRESYGHEIRHPKWRAQFFGHTAEQHLKLDKQIRNISGATLSCRHVTDGVNRLMHTWQLVLKDLQ